MGGSFNPDMMLVAREYRGMSQSALSKITKIPQSKISKVENFVTEPDDEFIIEVARKLEFPLDFFFQAGRAIGQPMSVHQMFRKPASMGKKPLAKLAAEISIRVTTINKLLGAVDIEPSLRLPQYDAEDYDNDATSIAKMVRNTWLLRSGPIPNLMELVEKAGVFVFWCDFGYAMIDGVSVVVPGSPPCIFLNRDKPSDRMRFSLAHELGHIVMHRQPSLTMEDEANQFASELLMPKDDIKNAFRAKITLAELARLKRVWRVSMQALLFRATSLELVSKSQSAYLWRQISKLGYRKQEPVSTEFPHEIPRTLTDIFGLYENQLEYSIDDLTTMALLYHDDFKHLYGANLSPEKKLRLVK